MRGKRFKFSPRQTGRPVSDTVDRLARGQRGQRSDFCPFALSRDPPPPLLSWNPQFLWGQSEKSHQRV